MTRLISIVSAFVLLGSTAVLAGEKINFDRASLERSDYVESTFRQIHSAAKRQCIREKSDAPLGLRYRQACMVDAIETAVAEIDHPNLTAYANGAVRNMIVAAAE